MCPAHRPPSLMPSITNSVFTFYIVFNLCGCMCACGNFRALMCTCSQRPEGIRPSGTEVSGSCKPPNMGAGDTMSSAVVSALDLGVISPGPQKCFSEVVV